MITLSVNWVNVSTITGIGLGMVFFILCLLVYILKLFGVLAAPKAKTKEPRQMAAPVQTTVDASEAEKAAIAMALHLYYAEVHDTESYRLTISHSGNSAWSSKIYGINNLVK